MPETTHTYAWHGDHNGNAVFHAVINGKEVCGYVVYLPGSSVWWAEVLHGACETFWDSDHNNDPAQSRAAAVAWVESKAQEVGNG